VDIQTLPQQNAIQPSSRHFVSCPHRCERLGWAGCFGAAVNHSGSGLKSWSRVSGLERIAVRLRRILTDRQLGALGIDRAALSLDEHVLDPTSLGWINADVDADPFNTVARIECALYMGNTLLRDTDVVSMANSLEVRLPLLDQSVVDWVMQLPERCKTQPGGPTKYLLRAALRGLIPESLLKRPKTGFCMPIDRWMHGPLRDSCQADIEYLAGNGPLDSREIRRIWNEFLASPANVHWVRPMALVALGSYLRNRSTAA